MPKPVKYHDQLVCPHCQAPIHGTGHSCQDSAKDNYFRNLGLDAGHNSGDFVKREREFFDTMNSTGSPFKFNIEPWGREDGR